MKKKISGFNIFVLITVTLIALISTSIFFVQNPGPDYDTGTMPQETENPEAEEDPVIASPTPQPEEPEPEPEPPPEPEPEEPEPEPEEPEPEPEPTPDPEPEPDEVIISIAEQHPELKRTLDNTAARYNSVAVSFAYFDGDAGEYYTYQYGLADRSSRQSVDEDTKFRVASLAKLVTVICAMTLVDEGKLDLDVDISEYLGYRVRNPGHTNTPITSRMLMQHTSSIQDSNEFNSTLTASVPRSVQQLLGSGSTYGSGRPGTRFSYSNFAFSVLGAVCEKVSGKMLDTFSREVLFAPLDIDAAYVAKNLRDTENIAVLYNSGHNRTRSVAAQLDIVDSDGVLGHNINLAQGGLIINAVDYARILAMLGNNGELHGIRILSPESVYEINNTNAPGQSYEQGLATRFSPGVFNNEGFFWHTGSAYGLFAQYMYSADETNRGVVVITTGASIERLRNGMVNFCTDLSRQAWQYFS